MALILKNSPVGVDKSIDTIQNALYTELVTNGTWTNYESYHRAYRNETKNGIKPEIFTGDGNDYADVYMDDKFTLTSFFLTGDETSISDDMFTSNISVIFQVNLNKLYTTALHRFDEEFRNEIVKVLKDLDGTFNFVSATTSIDGVYSGLDTEQVNLNDIHPCHVVRFELEATYTHACDNAFATSGVTCNISVNVTTTDETSVGADDGTATANVSGTVNGTLSYLWDTVPPQFTQTATGLPPDTYTVIVTDSIPASPVCTATDQGVVNSPAFDFGNALRFNGTSNRLTHMLLTVSGDLTSSIWVYIEGANDAPVVLRGNNFNYTRVRLDTSEVVLLMEGNSLVFDMPASITNQMWINVVTSRISGFFKTYINGVESTTGSLANSDIYRVNGVSSFPGILIDGLTDEYGVTNGVGATAQNAIDLYNNGNGNDYQDIMSSASIHLKFNESGTDAIAMDSSGNNRNGTLVNYTFIPSPWEPH